MSDTEVTVTSGSAYHLLTVQTRIAYSVGHILNDLCASMWFTYLLVYLHFVLQFDNSVAGYLILIGQVADAMATPFVGIESDRRDNFWCCRYGRRKTWHLVGTLCVLGSFPFLFLKCVGCTNSHQSAQLIYYAAFIVIFQFGWAAVQISHLSLIPDLTPVSSEREELNAFRYAATVASNILVYSVTWVALGLNTGGGDSLVSPRDAPEFLHIVLVVISVGALFSFIFHIGVKEPPHLLTVTMSDGSINKESSSLEPLHHLTWRDWFREKQFYQIGLLYMGTRLYNNLNQVYIPLYLQHTLRLPKESIAFVPLAIYLTGFFSSFLVKFASRKVGKKMVYAVGCILGLSAALWMYFGSGESFHYWEIFIISVLIGIAGSTMLITSLSLTSDLIGHHTSSAAFVFGAMSFVDKLSNGIAILVIQDFHPCISCCSECRWYYEYVLVFASGGAALLALIALLLLLPSEIGTSQERNGLLRNNRADTIENNSRENCSDSDACFNDDAPLIIGVDKASKSPVC